MTLSFLLYTPDKNGPAAGRGHILLHSEKPAWVRVNDTGLEIARALQSGRTGDEAARSLAPAHGISVERARDDVRYVIRELEKAGFFGGPARAGRVPGHVRRGLSGAHHAQVRDSGGPARAFHAPAEFEGRTLTSLFLHLTERCNLECGHCYLSRPEGGRAPSGEGATGGGRAPGGTGPPPEEQRPGRTRGPGRKREGPRDLPAEAALRVMAELAGEGGKAVTLSGGEALLHPEIGGILRAAASQFEVSLLTNGTLVDGRWARLLADLGVHVQISLDGAKAETHDRHRGKGSFDSALRAVRRLQDAGAGDRLNLCTTVMTQNLGELKAIIALAEELGVPLARFIPLRKRGGARKAWGSIGSGVGVRDLEQFYRYAGELTEGGGCSVAVSCGLSGFVLKITDEMSDDGAWCPAGRQLVVYTNGDVYPCVLLEDREFRLGNIHTDSLSRMRESATMKSLWWILAERRRRMAKCAACLWRNLCQAGCMGLALEQRGTFWGTDDFCEFRRRAYREAFDRLLAARR